MNPDRHISKSRGVARATGTVLLVLLAGSPACRRGSARPAPRAPESAPAPVALWPRYGFRPEERQAVQEFLDRNPRLRLPEDSDRRVAPSGEGDVRHLYGVYHPYFVRGDLNDDGLLDFVIGFVRRDSSPSTPWFTVVVFAGRERAPGRVEFDSQTFLERDISLAAGDLSIDRDAILITPDLADETTRRYRWDPARRSYVFVRDEVREVESPDFSQT